MRTFLLYLLLQLGFKGKYGRAERGAESLADIGNTIYRLVRDERLAEQEKVTLVDVKSKYLKKTNLENDILDDVFNEI